MSHLENTQMVIILTLLARFNDIAYVRPKVPTLYTALTTGEYANNATVYVKA